MSYYNTLQYSFTKSNFINYCKLTISDSENVLIIMKFNLQVLLTIINLNNVVSQL